MTERAVKHVRKFLGQRLRALRKQRALSQERLGLGVGRRRQAFISAGFLVQWIASERAQKSVVPRPFWFFSVGGGMTLLAYAIYRLDPVFILGQAAGLFVYARNLYFIYRRPERLAHG